MSLKSERGSKDTVPPAIRKKEKITGFIMTVIMSACLGALAAFMTRRGMTPEAKEATSEAGMYVLNILESIAAGIILLLILPFGRWGNMLAQKAGAKPPAMKFNLIRCLPAAVGNSVLVSLIVSLINTIQAHARIPAQAAPPLFGMWFGNWIRLLPLSIAVSYVLSVAISPLVAKAVGLNRFPAGKPMKK